MPAEPRVQAIDKREMEQQGTGVAGRTPMNRVVPDPRPRSAAQDPVHLFFYQLRKRISDSRDGLLPGRIGSGSAGTLQSRQHGESLCEALTYAQPGIGGRRFRILDRILVDDHRAGSTLCYSRRLCLAQ